MPKRHLPVRPDLDQLKNQAKDLLRAIHAREADAVADLREFHPEKIEPASTKLADAQFVLARSYEAPSWPRLVVACNLIDAIWRDDVNAVRKIAAKNPRVLFEETLLRKNSNWGPPLSYAANLGRDAIIDALREMGATDFRKALVRAALQGKVETVRKLRKFMPDAEFPADILSGSAYTISASGTAVLFELGVKLREEGGNATAHADVVLGSDSRKPAEKHAILEMYAQHGFVIPDTPVMALHRGRIDLLEEHLRRDPAMLRRTFSHEEIYPPEFGGQDAVQTTQGTPLAGTTLLHLCADYDELEIAQWLIAKGMDVNAKAAIDREGFGGHTALFGTVVSQPAFWVHHLRKEDHAPIARLLLEHGADVTLRATLRKRLHPGYGEDVMREYRDVTPLGWGEQYFHKKFVSEGAMKLIRERGGTL
jgi:ankyrin repeat protein